MHRVALAQAQSPDGLVAKLGLLTSGPMCTLSLSTSQWPGAEGTKETLEGRRDRGEGSQPRGQGKMGCFCGPFPEEAGQEEPPRAISYSLVPGSHTTVDTPPP